MDNLVLKEVPFGNSIGFLVTSPTLRSYIAQRIVEWILPFREVFPPKGILAMEFPLEPVDGLVNTCFEWIRRYTYIQHNYMLFAFTIADEPDCSDLNIVQHLHRKCVVFVDKVHKQFYLVKYRFGDEIFKGTLLDGVLLQDRAVYNPLTPNYLSKDFTENKCELVDDAFSETSDNSSEESSDVKTSETSEGEETSNESSDKSSEEKINERPVITDPVIILENYKKVTAPIDYRSIYQHYKDPPKYVFYIQAVYALSGESIEYSLDKLVDAISYKTCISLHTKLLGNSSNYIYDAMLESVELKNAVDTMYYTRHTKMLLKNPFSNDYLRYQPTNGLPVDINGNLCKNTKISFKEWVKRDIAHFFPLIDKNGKVFMDHYTLDQYVIKCHVERTKDVYVYKLSSNDSRFDKTINDGYAKIWTYEGTRYLRVLFHKIHIAYRKNGNGSAQDDKPLYMQCIGVKNTSTNKYVGWTPILYDNNTNKPKSTKQPFKTVTGKSKSVKQYPRP